MLNNIEWLAPLNYIDFLREIGVHFSVNKMLAMDAFKTRLEKGLSFLEFNYTLMQGYDFYHLFNSHNCKLQMGGSDQWSNIIAGVELIRKKNQAQAYGLTFTLLTNKDGQKMGKTEKGAVWLDAEKTSPYEFYQYWRNVDDAIVCRCLSLLTDVPMQTIRDFSERGGEHLNEAKQLLAMELTSVVHSPEQATQARDAALALFSNGADSSAMPTTELSGAEIPDDGIEILDLLMKCNLIPSKGEGRRLIAQGGISVDEQKITDIDSVITRASLAGKGVVIRKGKKIFHRVCLAE